MYMHGNLSFKYTVIFPNVFSQHNAMNIIYIQMKHGIILIKSSNYFCYLTFLIEVSFNAFKYTVIYHFMNNLSLV